MRYAAEWYDTHIMRISYSYHTHIIYVSYAYHMRESYIDQPHIIYVSYAYHARIKRPHMIPPDITSYHIVSLRIIVYRSVQVILQGM